MKRTYSATIESYGDGESWSHKYAIELNDHTDVDGVSGAIAAVIDPLNGLQYRIAAKIILQMIGSRDKAEQHVETLFSAAKHFLQEDLELRKARHPNLNLSE